MVRHETDENIRFFILFQILEVLKTEQVYIRAKISEPFCIYDQQFKQGFMAFELAEFSNLSSKYEQIIYRLLKQFRSSGLLSLEWSEFVRILDIPKTYQIAMHRNLDHY
ncbi:MAG: replication initiation protein [Campylobacter sp.]